VTTAVPVPDDPLDTFSHAASGDAVQLQFGCVVTVVVTLPPAIQRLTSTGATEY
jgi:hypothetical protein